MKELGFSSSAMLQSMSRVVEVPRAVDASARCRSPVECVPKYDAVKLEAFAHTKEVALDRWDHILQITASLTTRTSGKKLKMCKSSGTHRLDLAILARELR